MDVVVEGRALIGGELVSCCIGIEDGRIAKIAKTIQRADDRFDFSDLVIMPSGIDLHVHFRDPGLTNKEDFSTGSMAAAAGGVTYVMDMPNTKPPTRSASDLEEKISIASKKSYVDFGIAALLDEKTDAARLRRAAAFKVYLGGTTGGLGINVDSLAEVLANAGNAAKPVFIHAEHVAPLKEMEEKSLDDHEKRRSGHLEAEAAARVAKTDRSGARIHLVHVTQPEILELARKSGMTAEVAPHHLILDSGMPLGTYGKMNPPLRSKAARARLWEAFAEGRADTLGSDHSPHTTKEKDVEFDLAPSGMPGTETMIPLMLQKVAERKIGLACLSRCCSERPAEIIGLRKGKIAVGYDADLIAVDLRKSAKIRAEKLHSKCGWTAYEGMPAVFPAMTMLRGAEISRFGEITGEREGRTGETGKAIG